MGCIPIPVSDIYRRTAWNELHDEGVVAACRSHSTANMASNKAWKPIHAKFQDVPLGHCATGDMEKPSQEERDGD